MLAITGRPGRPLRLALAALLSGLSFACGGGDGAVTAPPPVVAPPVIPPAAGVLVAAVDSARPREFVAFRPAGLGRAVPDTATGAIGSVAIRAIRIDDSTLVALMPASPAGSQTVRFDLGGRSFTTQLVVRPELVVADPTAAANALFDRVLARYDSINAALASSALAGADTAVTRRFAAAGRAATVEARSKFLALTMDERRDAIPYIVAEAAAVGLQVAPTSSAVIAAANDPLGTSNIRPYSASISSSRLCTLLTSFETCGQLGEAGDAIRAATVEVARCSAKTLGTSALGGVVGGVIGGGIGFFAGAIGSVPGGIAGVKNGAAIGAGVGIAWCMSDVFEKLAGVYEAAVKPVLVSVEEALATRTPADGVRMNVAAAGTAPSAAFTSGVSKQVDVYVDFRSLSAEDASGPPALANLVSQFSALSRTWDALRTRFSFVDMPAITLPAAPRVTIRKRVPGSYLSVSSVTPAAITASGAGDPWRVTFTNAAQGDDHDFAYTVRFKYAGFPDQERPLSSMLRPSRYTVASLNIANDTVLVQKSVTLVWSARDSSGDVLTDSLLAGRRPAWTTESAGIATVSATGGAVTGVAAGSAGITGRLETGRTTATVLVVPDITGTYTLISQDGVAIPGVTYLDSLYKIETFSGSVTILADGTFSFRRSAKGSNLRNTETFDEGGSGRGTYVVDGTGTSVVFTTIERVGVPLSYGGGSIVDGTLRVSVSSPDGSGTAVLKKQ